MKDDDVFVFTNSPINKGLFSSSFKLYIFLLTSQSAAVCQSEAPPLTCFTQGNLEGMDSSL